MNIAAAVILYHPDLKTTGHILSYARQVNRLYILDNSENNNVSKEIVTALGSLSHVIYIHDGINKGISIRLNEATNRAIEEGYDCLLTMDQDSYFDQDTIPVYVNCIQNFTYKEQVAMFGVQFENRTTNAMNCEPKEADHLITSGSMLNLKLFKEIGPFDEALFIDKVDHEYCLRARLHHYKIIQFDTIFLNHSLGTITYGRSLKNLKLTPRVIHSPIRMYYIIRNYFYLKSKYKNQFKESFAEMKEELWIRSKNNFLYGPKKAQLLKYMVKGFMDYKNKRMGKLV
jgi:rhamnosyltransferase